MGTRQENLRAALFAANVVNVSAHAVAVTHVFPRDHLVTTDDAFATAEIDDDIAIFDALDGAVDDFADAVLELVILAVTLGFAHLLHDDLLGGLGGDTAEIHRRQRIGDEVAELGVRVAVAGQLQRDLGRIVLGGLDNFQKTLQADFAGLGIDVGADVGFRTIARAGGFLDSVGHCGKHDFAVDDLFARHSIGDLQKLKPVSTHCHFSISVSRIIALIARFSGFTLELVFVCFVFVVLVCGGGLGGLVCPQRITNKVVRQNELRIGKRAERNDDCRLLAIGDLVAFQPEAVSTDLDDLAAKPLAVLDQNGGFDLHQMALPAGEIRFTNHRPVDAGRGNFEMIRFIDRIFHIKNR